VDGEFVVDLGAGMGAATVEAAMSGATVVAVDPMPQCAGSSDAPSHPWHERVRGRRARHGHPFENADPDVVAASLSRAGFSAARGSHTTIAGRPVKLVRATR
jgi:hypothetical protein